MAKPRAGGRPAPSRRPHRLARAAALLRRLLSFVGRRLRRYGPPPYADKHLCRDIGIEPPPKPPAWPWPGVDPRA